MAFELKWKSTLYRFKARRDRRSGHKTFVSTTLRTPWKL